MSEEDLVREMHYDKPEDNVLSVKKMVKRGGKYGFARVTFRTEQQLQDVLRFGVSGSRPTEQGTEPDLDWYSIHDIADRKVYVKNNRGKSDNKPTETDGKPSAFMRYEKLNGADIQVQTLKEHFESVLVLMSKPGQKDWIAKAQTKDSAHAAAVSMQQQASWQQYMMYQQAAQAMYFQQMMAYSQMMGGGGKGGYGAGKGKGKGKGKGQRTAKAGAEPGENGKASDTAKEDPKPEEKADGSKDAAPAEATEAKSS